MKFIHISDLHFGKNLGSVSLIEDQAYWTDRFTELCREERPQAVVVAGDLYDRSVPSAEAVALCDRFVTEIAKLDIPLLVVAGNHDSGTRLQFASGLLEKQNVHIAGDITARMRKVTLTDEAGPVNFWLMPFVFPGEARRVLPEAKISSYEDAARALIDAQSVNTGERNVIVAHQNVTENGLEKERGGSETAVGGVDGMDFGVFAPFDYAALGHIHAAYHVGRDSVRYCGSPLNYHFDEAKKAKKGPLIVTLGEKGTEPEIRLAEIEPLHRMVELRGDEFELLRAALDDGLRNTYVKAVLTGCRLTPEFSGAVRAALEGHEGCVCMIVTSDYAEREGGNTLNVNELRVASNAELFIRYYRDMNGGADPDERDERLFYEIEDICRNYGGDRGEPTDDAVEALLRFIGEQEEE